MRNKTGSVFKVIGTILIVIFSFIVGYVFADQKYEEIPLLSDEIKVAIVNNDQGVEIEDETVIYSDIFLKKYKSDSNYQFTSLNDAKQGKLNGLYSGYIVIPEDFSKDVASLTTAKKKAIIIYDVVDNNYLQTKPSLTLINDVINTLDDGVTKGYLRDILSNIAGVLDKTDNMDKAVNGNNLLINQINPTNWLQPLKLDEAIRLSASDSDIRNALSSLGGIKDNISGQIVDNLSNKNDKYNNLGSNYLDINNTISSIDSAKYYHVSLPEFDLVKGYKLKAKDGSALDIYINRDDAKTYVKFPNNSVLIVTKENVEIEVQGNSSINQQNDVCASVLSINDSLINNLNDYNQTKLSLFGYDFTIYGTGFDIVEANGKVVISGAYKVVTSNNVDYYPINGKIEINFYSSTGSPFTTKDVDNYDQLIIYNKVSSALLNQITSISQQNPDMSINEVLMELINQPSDDVVNNLSVIDTNVDVQNYLTQVSPAMFDEFVGSYLENQKGIEYNTQVSPNGRCGYDSYNIVGDTAQRVPNTLHTTGNVVITSQEVLDLTLLKTQINALGTNFNILVSSVVNNMDYQIIDNSYNNVNTSVSQFINMINTQVSQIDDVNNSNRDKVNNYINDINSKIKENTDNIKNSIIANNTNVLEIINNMDDNMDTVIKSGSVDERTLNFLSSSIDQQVEGLDNNTKQDVDKEEGYLKYILLAGLAISLGGVSYAIYREKNKSDEV